MINFRAVCLNFFSFAALVVVAVHVLLFSLCPMSYGQAFKRILWFFFLSPAFFCLFTYLALTNEIMRVTDEKEEENMNEKLKKKHSLTKIIHKNRYLFVNSSNYCVWCGTCVCVCVIFFSCLFVHFNLVCSMFMFNLFWAIIIFFLLVFKGWLNGMSVSPES